MNETFKDKEYLVIAIDLKKNGLTQSEIYEWLTINILPNHVNMLWDHRRFVVFFIMKTKIGFEILLFLS
jgi:hypothetical protein